MRTVLAVFAGVTLLLPQPFLFGPFGLQGTAFSQIVSPTGTYPPPPGVPLFDLSTEYGRVKYELYMLRMAENQRVLVNRQALNRQAAYVRTTLAPLYAKHRGEDAWEEAWAYIQERVQNNILLGPLRAENGDWLGQDNDDNDKPEPEYVRSYVREGLQWRGHYRALDEEDLFSQ